MKLSELSGNQDLLSYKVRIPEYQYKMLKIMHEKLKRDVYLIGFFMGDFFISNQKPIAQRYSKSGKKLKSDSRRIFPVMGIIPIETIIEWEIVGEISNGKFVKIQ